ncbi:MAG: MMPL family transporter, partial [Epsilonproteobacteria bacterium]|nr:MMPL family transporter [Campylobacterota bacterium]
LFGKFGEFIAQNPLKVIFTTILLLAYPLANVKNITFDTSNEGFLHKSDPILKDYNSFREQFGRDERIVIAIESDKIFTIPFLEKLKRLHKELEDNLPYLDEVTSLYNVRNTRGEKNQLIVEDLLEKFPKDSKDLEKLREIVKGSEFYRNLFISEDLKLTTIIIETKAFISEDAQDLDELLEGFEETSSKVKRVLLTDEQNSEIVQKTREIVSKYNSSDFKIYYAGSPSVLDALKRMMKADMQKFTRVTILIIVIFLFLIFRRVSATIYPIIVIVLSLLTTVGLMAIFGVAFKLPTQILPSLLIAVSIGATVHILSIFFDRFNKTGDKKEALIYTMSHSGLAIAMTSITTAIGIGSFAGSEVAPISDMGIFASFGVLISLFLTLTLFPALLILTKLKPKPTKQRGKLDFFMKKLAYIPSHYSKQIIYISSILVVVALILVSKLHTSHYPLEWFPKDDPNCIGTKYIDAKMRGSLTAEVIIDTEKENGWQDANRLEKLDRLTKELEGYSDGKSFIGKIISLNTIVKETNRALHENNQSFYRVPDNQALVSQELLLFENSGSDDLEDIVDSQFSKVRVTHKLPWIDSIDSIDILNHIKGRYEESFRDSTITLTGIIPILVHTFANSIKSSIESYYIAFTLIAISMILIMGSFRLGLISMIPNLVPIIFGLALMYTFKMPLDMFTLLIGSIAIGLAVDDTIHFMHNFKRYYKATNSSIEAIEKTFFTTGKAMVITTIVLSLGFFAYMFGRMESVQNFGFITGSVIIFALLADIFLAPAIMVELAKRGKI